MEVNLSEEDLKGDLELGSGSEVIRRSSFIGSSRDLSECINEDSINLTPWSQKQRERGVSKDYQWNNNSIIRNRQASGRGENVARGYNTTREYKGHLGVSKFSLLRMDWFHTLLESNIYKIFGVMMLYYVTSTTFFALLWLWEGSGGDSCDTGILNFTDAYYFSLITFSTIGYGAKSTFFNSCSYCNIGIHCNTYSL